MRTWAPSSSARSIPARPDIWVDILNAPDGGWGIGGVAYTGDDLIAAVTAYEGTLLG